MVHERWQDQLNKLGQVGWELVQVGAIGTTLRLFMKRML
jgi:hypothetical protein